MKKLITLIFISYQLVNLNAQSVENTPNQNNKESNPIANDELKINENINSIDEYKYIIKNINDALLYTLFSNKYLKDPDFHKASLAKEDLTKSMNNYNVILHCIVIDKDQSENDRLIAQKAFKFNVVHTKFFKLNQEYKEFFDNKYMLSTAEDYIQKLENLDLQDFSGLSNDRDKLIKNILKYKEESCQLKKELDKLKIFAKDDNDALRSKYQGIEKKYQFPYLKTVVRNMSNNLSSYTADSLEDNCAVAEKEQSTKAEEATNNEKDTPTAVEEESQEVVKENTNEASKEETINEVKEDKNKKKNSKKGKVKEEGEDKKDNTNPSQERENGLTID